VANGMFGTPVSRFDNTPQQFGYGLLSGPRQDQQYGGINDAYATPGAYGPYNGNSSVTGFYGAGLGSSYDNYRGGYLNNDGGYRGYSPYYGNNGGYGVNYGAVNSSSYGNYSSPAYYGSGYYTKGISGNGYSP
jgi:hypothetical protein